MAVAAAAAAAASASAAASAAANAVSTSASFNRWINAAFRKHGLSLRGDAGQALKAKLDSDGRADKDDIQKLLTEVVGAIKAKRGAATAATPFVELDAMMAALSALDKQAAGKGGADRETYVEFVDSFALPKSHFVPRTLALQVVPHANLTLHGSANDKAEMLRDRFTLLLQRTLRQPGFQLPASGAADASHAVRAAAAQKQSAAHAAAAAAAKERGEAVGETVTLTPLESLMARSGSKTVFGMLTQLVDGQLFLEDLNTHVPCDLSAAHDLTRGLVADHCFVLAQGTLRDGVFRVTELAFPPPERRVDTLRGLSQLQRCGLLLQGVSDAALRAVAEEDHERSATVRDEKTQEDVAVDEAYVTAKANAMSPADTKDTATVRLLTLSREAKMQARATAIGGDDDAKGELIVILSDVFLDKPKVLDKLMVLFDGYKESAVSMFVLMGNFTSRKLGTSPGDLKQLRGYFDGLCDTILKFPNLAHKSQFVFMCGPNDGNLSVGNVLPRMPLAPYFTQKLRDKLRHAHFVSNPCRVLYYSQEIVLFRDDLLHRLCKASLFKPKSDGNALHQAMIKTVLDQSHLCPVPVMTRPIYWNYDHALRLYPLPDTLVLADTVDFYDEKYADCHTFNPGAFSTDFSFAAYYPATNTVQPSKIPAEATYAPPLAASVGAGDRRK